MIKTSIRKILLGSLMGEPDGDDRGHPGGRAEAAAPVDGSPARRPRGPGNGRPAPGMEMPPRIA